MKFFRRYFSFLLILLALSSYGDDKKSSETGNIDVKTGLKPVSTSITSVNTAKIRIAFLVGINSYKATTSLKYAVGDSNAIEDLLLKTGKYDKLIKLTDQGKVTTIYNPEKDSYASQNDSKIKPTKTNIEATYQEVLADNPDTLLFYYSGHGFIEGEGGENYIAPKDVDVKFEKRKVGKEEKQVPVPLNGISLKKMGVSAAKVKRVVFLIDACRSPLPEAEEESISPAKDAGKKDLTAKSTKGDVSKDAKSAKNAKDTATKDAKVADEKEQTRKAIFLKSEILPKRVLEAEGITMLIGAAPEVSSLEDEDFKSGIFTHFLKKAFNGGVQDENQEEYITEENLSRYIEDRFKDYYEKRKKETEFAAEPKLYNLTFDRGKKGEILITYHRPIEGLERIDKPVYFDESREREVNGKLVYNEKGKREELRFFAKDKQRDQFYPDSLASVHKMKYAFENDTKGELKKFESKQFNLENQEVFTFGTTLLPDKGWEYRGLYSTDGLQSVSTPEKTKIRFERQIFDFNGNNILQEYFDNKGQLLEIEGVATVVRAWDFNGEKTLEETYDKEGKLVDKGGFARYTASYKSKGNPITENWYGKNGEYANNESGFARVHFIYDETGRLTKKIYYDKESKLSGDKWGVATYTYSYNSDCIRFYESQLFEKDEFGDEDPNKEQSRQGWKLGKYKLCLAEEIHTDKEGKPAGDEKKIYKKVRAFNEKGFLVSEENFRPDDRRHLENGVAKVVYTHDEDGNVISRKNYGEFEIIIKNDELRVKNEGQERENPLEKRQPVPVSDGNGVHEYRYTYQEYFSYDGKPILNECIYHRKDKGILLAPYECAIKLEHYGINGKPIEDKRNVFRTNIYYTGAYQAEADRHYYSLKNQNLSVEKGVGTINPFGSQTLWAVYVTKEGKEVLVSKYEYKFDERNNNTLEAKYETKEGKEVLVLKKEYKYDERNNQTLSVTYGTEEGKEGLVWKHEYKYDERNNKTLDALYETREGKEVLELKKEYKYDERNNKTLEAKYRTKDGKEVLVSKYEYKYDERNNKTLEARYETEEGKEILIWKKEYKYDERNNNTLVARYETKEGKAVLVSKEEAKYDERNNKTLEAEYKTIEGKEILARKHEYKYDERNNQTLYALYETKEGREVLVWKDEAKYDERNNKTLEAKYETDEGKEVLAWKYENKYDKRNNKTLEEKYETKEGKEILIWKKEYNYDERNNQTLYANYRGEEETILEKSIVDYRTEFYANAVTLYEPQIKEIQKKLYKTKDESEKKTLNQNLEDLKKAFESKKKKYTLTEEKYGENEKLESASYKLLFFNPRGPAEKRLMRVDLDRFYRPVGVGFEEE